MSRSSRGASVTVVVPDLLTPLGAKDWDHALDPHVPCLRRLMARAEVRRSASQGFEATVCELFGLPIADECSLPIASLTYGVDTAGKTPPDGLVRADPIHLEVGVEEVVVTPADDLSIESGEAQALATALSRHFEERDWKVEAPTPNRWYLAVPDSPPLATPPPSRIMGRPLRGRFPTGEPGPFWLGVLNEIQMLLHDHAVNEARQAAGSPTINGLWLWGTGALGGIEPVTWSGVWADHDLPLALARSFSLSCEAGSDSMRSLLSRPHPGQHLLVFSGLMSAVQRDSWTEWVDALGDLEREVFEPLWRGLSQTWDAVEILPCDARRFLVSSAARWRIWRRTPALAAWAAPGEGGR